MRALGSTPLNVAIAARILQGLMRRIQIQPCKHKDINVAKGVRIFIKDGYLATPHDDDVTTLADKVVSCARPSCEKVFEVEYHGLKLRASRESGSVLARIQEQDGRSNNRRQPVAVQER